MSGKACTICARVQDALDLGTALSANQASGMGSANAASYGQAQTIMGNTLGFGEGTEA